MNIFADLQERRDMVEITKLESTVKFRLDRAFLLYAFLKRA